MQTPFPRHRHRQPATWRHRQPATWRHRLYRQLTGRGGQGSVEYALVLFSVLAIFAACGVLWRAFDEGLFVSHAAQSASHHLQDVAPGAIADVLLY